MADLGALQEQVWKAIREATRRGDARTLSLNGQIADEMERSYKDWVRRLSLVVEPIGTLQKDAHVRRPDGHSSELARLEDFTGRPIRAFQFAGQTIAVGTYKDLLIEVAQLLLRRHADDFKTVAYRVRGRGLYFSNTKGDLRIPAELKPGLYVETNLNANLIVDICRRLVEAFGYEPAILRLDVVPFRTRAQKRTTDK